MLYIFELCQCLMLKPTLYYKINDNPIWLIKSISIVLVSGLAIEATVNFDPSENIKQILKSLSITHRDLLPSNIKLYKKSTNYQKI